MGDFFRSPYRYVLVLGPLTLVTGLCFFLLRPAAATAVKPPTPEFVYRPEDKFLKRGNESLDEVALTFDDGPHPESLNRILKVLYERRVQATFFLVGRRIKEHPEAARQILYAGHEVGNHTMNHERLDTMPPEQIRAEIEECEKVFEDATGRTMTLFRPPGLRVNQKVLQVTRSLNLCTVGYTNACKDFETEQTKMSLDIGKEFFDRLYRGMKGGAILLMHDTPETAQALDEIIVHLQAAGYKFVTVSEMLSKLPNPVTLEANPSMPRIETVR